MRGNREEIKRKLRTRLVCFGLVCLVIFAGGCGVFRVIQKEVGEATNTPRKQWLLASDTLTATRNSLATLIRQDKLTDEQVQEVKKWEPVANEALNTWDSALEDGLPTEQAVSRFWRAIRRLKEVKKKGEQNGS